MLSPDDAFILSPYAEILLQVAEEHGASRKKLLEQAAVGEASLADPEGFLTLRQFRQLVEGALAETGNPALGLNFGHHLKFTTHGPLSQAAVSSATLREALGVLTRYFRIRFAAFDICYFVEGDEAVIQLDDRVGLQSLEPFMVETFFASMMDVNSLLLGDRLLQGGRCLIRYSRPAHAAAYRSVFLDALYFDQPANQLRFDAMNLNLPMPLANPVARRLAIEECERAMGNVQQEASILVRVRRRLARVETGFPGLEALAGEMGMSSRTLRRQLDEFGVRYQDLLDEARLERARRLLASNSRPVEDIAEELGYSDSSNFSRAFRRWTGLSPAAYRRQRQGH